MNHKRVFRYLALASAAALTCVLVFAGVLGLRSVPSAMRPSSLVSRQALAPGSPLRPTEEIIVITPGPDGVVTLPTVRPGQIYAFPSPTPMPTWTPRPTPTRRPGPTATAMPLPKPAASAAGLIYYTTYTGDDRQAIYSQLSLPVDAQGQAKARPEPMPVPATLDFAPYRIVLSPDRRYVLYMLAIEPGERPLVHNNATGEIHMLFEHYSGGQFFGWHPDGRHFLFWIDDVGLWLIDAETLEMTTLAYPEGPVQGAAISPDGLTVVYIAEDRPTLGALWFVSAAGSDAKPLFDAGNTSFLYPTAWAPTNDRLVYHGNCPAPADGTLSSGMSSLCILNTATQTFQSLKLPYAGYAPVWSPDGRYIATTGIGPDEQPCVKPEYLDNPEKCVYQGRTIYIADTATGEVNSLTAGIAPIWSPDGSKIAFLTNRTGNSELWIIGRNGENERQMTTMGNLILPHSLTWLAEVQ